MSGLITIISWLVGGFIGGMLINFILLWCLFWTFQFKSNFDKIAIFASIVFWMVAFFAIVLVDVIFDISSGGEGGVVDLFIMVYSITGFIVSGVLMAKYYRKKHEREVQQNTL